MGVFLARNKDKKYIYLQLLAHYQDNRRSVNKANYNPILHTAGELFALKPASILASADNSPATI